MKTALVYLHIVGKSDLTAPPPSRYIGWSLRFKGSYAAFKGSVPHDLIIVHCGTPEKDKTLWPEAHEHICYVGGGWDVGAHQHAANLIRAEYDFVICAATPIYMPRPGFIEAMVKAVEKHGDGLYGPTASFEHHPHIRTCCWAFCPKTFFDYPLVDTRAKTFAAESGPERITKWYQDRKLPVYMVAVDGIYGVSNWRSPSNIFRRGDQSNCLVWDRHCDIYAAATDHEKVTLEKLADGLLP